MVGLVLPTFESMELPPLSESEAAKRVDEKAVRGELTGEPEVVPFAITETLPVVRAKLVKRILRGDYMDMTELLKDNMEAKRRR